MATKGRTLEVDCLNKEAKKDADTSHRCLRTCIQHQRPIAASHGVGFFCGFDGTIFFSVLTRKGQFATRHIFEASEIYERGLFQAQKEMTTDNGLVQNTSKNSCLARIHHSCHDPRVATHVKVTIMTDTKSLSWSFTISHNVAGLRAQERIKGQDER